MQPTQTLPEDFKEDFAFDLSKNIPAQVVLNFAALALVFTFGRGFVQLFGVLRPEFVFGGIGSLLQGFNLIAIIPTLFLMMLAHEAVHGIGFWGFTRSRPAFGLKLGYAYAAAPDWYVPRNQFVIVGLAPLVVLSVLGCVLAPWLLLAAMPALLVFLAMNAGGSVGDMFVVWKVAAYPPSALVNDRGESFTIYVEMPKTP
ncbi:MAG: DUF3267 domain-containing protein [Anaerolineae bacterium]|nr:DUF3267 domain-containing protein [Anaerolineae bacterium]